MALEGAAAPTAEEVPRITLPSGAVVSGYTMAPWGPPWTAVVNSYLGIRFATAKRFEAPVLYTHGPQEAVDGRQSGKPCLQHHANSGVCTEDCLTLDVYTPPGEIGAKRRPVMVFIHGGFLVFGSARDQQGHWNHLVIEGDLLVVSIQYRLNIFGFGYFNETMPANLGLRDQIVALRWIQRNIASFGGDPGCVTIFGQSAGGRSVTALYQAPLARGLFHRAISQSGGMLPSIFMRPSKMSAETMGRMCMEGTRCASLQCMKDLPAKRLWQKCPFYFDPVDFVPVAGRYFNGFDGEVLPHAASAPLCEGVVAANADVPIMLGGLLHEWRLFDLDGMKAKATVARNVGEFVPAAARTGGWCEIRALLEKFQNASCELGEVCKKISPPAWEEAATAFYSLGLGFVGRGSGARYRYLIDMEKAGGLLGSTHAAEFCFLVGTSWSTGGPCASDEVYASDAWQQTAKLVREYWTSFARDGVPRNRRGPEWNPVDPEVATWGVPQMVIRVPGQTSMSYDGFYTNTTQEMLTSLMCGREIVSSHFRCGA